VKYLMIFVLLISLLVAFPACAASTTSMPIVLLTDYGTDDYRVPRLKGVIYSANPGATIIDATHGIGSVDIAAGAYVLGLTAAEFPEDVVFMAAVGSADRGIVLINDKDQIFVLPDDGLATFVIMNTGMKKCYAITNEKLFDQPIENLSTHVLLGTVAAKIAGGYKPGDVGPEVASPVMLDIQQAGINDGKLMGYVVFVDHFGSCLTNISRELTEQFGLQTGDSILITVNGNTVSSVIGKSYGDVTAGESVSIVNSLGILQLSINMGSFAANNGVKTGMKVEIERAAP